MSDAGAVEVYRAKNGFQAHLFVTALEEAGIKAEIQGTTVHPSSATGEGLLTDTAPWWDAPRILVLAEDADRAKQLLLELEARERKEAPEANPPIEAVCDKCGCRASFPATQRGSVQQCPQCGAYLDVGEDESPDGWEDDEVESP
jgi:hypothetical protein